MNTPTTQTFNFQLNAEQTGALLNFIPKAKVEASMQENVIMLNTYNSIKMQVEKQLKNESPKPVMQPLPKETTTETPTE